MEIASVTAAYAPRPAADGIVPAVPLPAPPASEPLGPAATVDLGATPTAGAPASGPGDSDRRRVVMDGDSREMVFQVVDPASDTVVDQLPTESALRARAYAQDLAERRAEQAAARAVDRTA